MILKSQTRPRYLMTLHRFIQIAFQALERKTALNPYSAKTCAETCRDLQRSQKKSQERKQLPVWVTKEIWFLMAGTSSATEEISSAMEAISFLTAVNKFTSALCHRHRLQMTSHWTRLFAMAVTCGWSRAFLGGLQLVARHQAIQVHHRQLAMGDRRRPMVAHRR